MLWISFFPFVKGSHSLHLRCRQEGMYWVTTASQSVLLHLRVKLLLNHACNLTGSCSWYNILLKTHHTPKKHGINLFFKMLHKGALCIIFPFCYINLSYIQKITNRPKEAIADSSHSCADHEGRVGNNWFSPYILGKVPRNSSGSLNVPETVPGGAALWLQGAPQGDARRPHHPRRRSSPKNSATGL